MDSSWVRLTSQVALTTWAIAEIVMLAYARGHMAPVKGTRWAIAGLMCFAAWMFLSSISIFAVAVIPRADLVVVFAGLEAGAAIGAWGWLVSNVRTRFKISIGAQHNGAKG